MKKKGLSIKSIVAIGIGAAIFIILAKFAAIPSPIPNTTIQTAYAFLALMAVVFGPIVGGLIGLIGHALNDAISYGSIWWSWVMVSMFVGFSIGLLSNSIDIEFQRLTLKKIISFNVVQMIVQGIGWFLLAPWLDIWIYAEPANKVFAQGLFAGTLNMITVGVIGTILLVAYGKTRNQHNSLEREL